MIDCKYENDSLIIEGLAIPPQSNHQYIPVKMGGSTRMVKAKKSRDWADAMGLILNTIPFHPVRKWVLDGFFVSVDMQLRMRKEELYTKDGRARKWDATNRIKTMHDAISKASLVDDSIFWISSVEKVETDGESNCTIILKPYKPRKL